MKVGGNQPAADQLQHVLVVDREAHSQSQGVLPADAGAERFVDRVLDHVLLNLAIQRLKHRGEASADHSPALPVRIVSKPYVRADVEGVAFIRVVEWAEAGGLKIR